MSRDASFLFAGLKFDRKSFAKDFEVFKERKESEDLEGSSAFTELTKYEPNEGKSSTKKRKRKTAASVQGFNVFHKSSSLDKAESNDNSEDELALRKKEANQQVERDAIMRKNHNLHVTGSHVPSPLQSFQDLRTRYKCKQYLLRKFVELGYKEPTPIQRQAIPVLLSGRDCFACAPTGSGKTLAFVCPMLMKLKHGIKDGGVRAVILCPTRELAAQTTRECKKLAKGKKFSIKLMTKGLSRSADFSKMPCDILISTPLRLSFAIRKRKLDLSRVEYLVLDESDKLFELGFVKQIDFVVKACSNPSIIRSLFSATLPDNVEELARTIMHDAVRIIVGKKNTASELIKQKLVFAGSEQGKLLSLRQSFSESWNPPILIFVQSKERAKELHKELVYSDIKVDVIHADLSQEQRDNAVDDFRAGKTWVLIATDVIARGMDFKGVNCVINYDFPESASAYIHRIGRSGRAGRSGEAITLYTEEDVPFLRNVANVMVQSGCEVPSWILSLPKKKWKKHRPHRDSISTMPENDDQEALPKKKWKKHKPQKNSMLENADQEALPTKKSKKRKPQADSMPENADQEALPKKKLKKRKLQKDSMPEETLPKKKLKKKHRPHKESMPENDDQEA